MEKYKSPIVASFFAIVIIIVLALLKVITNRYLITIAFYLLGVLIVMLTYVWYRERRNKRNNKEK